MTYDPGVAPAKPGEAMAVRIKHAATLIRVGRSDLLQAHQRWTNRQDQNRSIDLILTASLREFLDRRGAG